MIIEILNQKFADSVGLSVNRQVIAPRDETPKESKTIIRKTIVPEKFEKDIQALKEFVGESGFQPGTKISLTLQEMLKIAVRERARTDAYSSLIRFLKEEMDIELIITSNKTKNKSHG